MNLTQDLSVKQIQGITLRTWVYTNPQTNNIHIHDSMEIGKPLKTRISKTEYNLLLVWKVKKGFEHKIIRKLSD